MVKTGKAPLSTLTFWAIMSLSLVVNLPGLAVTPMLATLEKVFPGTTQIEEQLLTVLPNLLIIPFVLLSGKLSLTRHKRAVVVGALLVYLLCGVSYLLARSMTTLIIASCVLGCGAGLVIPFSTGFIADCFEGKYRMKEMGLQSGLSNMTLVAATYAVGWLSHGGLASPFRGVSRPPHPAASQRRSPRIPAAHFSAPKPAPAPAATPAPGKTPDAPAAPRSTRGFYVKRLLGVMGVYFFISFATVTITLYCPFLIEKKDWSTSLSGTVTSLYFLFIFIPGFVLPWIVRHLKGGSFAVCAVMMTIGIGLFAFFPDKWALCLGASLAGLGYGVCQPLIYNKASRCVSDPKKATLALSFVLSANYIAIVVTPFIISLLRSVFGVAPGGSFAFILGFALLVVYTGVTILARNSFALNVTEKFYD